jgi:hypothetical protein
VGLPDQRLSRLADLRGEGVPYFSVILVYKGAEGWISELPLAAGASA